MTTGNVMYLAMALVTFGAFSVVLAYQSWRQSSLGPDMIVEAPDNLDHQDMSDEVTA